ncbi:MAG: DMT family transporter [Rhodobacteraceae bacterium]|nr:DMT family transporter [Paracoccaceae bacterium]
MATVHDVAPVTTPSSPHPTPKPLTHYPLVELWIGAPPPIRAAILMAAAAAMFSTMGAFIRLASAHLHVLEVVFFRNMLSVLMFAPLLYYRGPALLRTKRLGLYGRRAVVGMVAMIAGFASVTLIPLAEATALNFTAPLFVTVLAVFVLGERIRLHRTGALVIGFLGVLVVLQPGLGGGAGALLSLGAGLALLSAVCIAISSLMVKRLTSTEPPEAIALWMVVMMTPATLIPALFVWSWPSWEGMFWLICLAAAGTLAHLCWTRACAIAELSQIQPIEFVKLPFAGLIGYLVFGEAPTIWVWLGGGAIFASTAYITHREAQLARSHRGATDPINR